MDAAIERNTKGLVAAGFLSTVSNRKALRVGQEPSDGTAATWRSTAVSRLLLLRPGAALQSRAHWQPQTRHM